MTWPHPLTHWPTQPPTNPPMDGVSLQIINLQTELNYLDLVNIFKFLVIWPEPSHQPTHPPTHEIIHPPMGGEVSTDFKSSNRIEISRLVQVLLNFDWFWGSPLGGGGGWMRWGWWQGLPTHISMHVHAHACTYDIIGNPQDFPKIQWGRSFAWNCHVYHACTCMCVHVCMCTCVGGISQPSPTPIHPAPPTPRAAGSPKHQNSISLELIEIFQFCLKILYIWTFLNSYRL